MRVQVKLRIGSERRLDIEKKSEIGETYGNKCCPGSLAAPDEKVATAAIQREKTKRVARLLCPAQTDAPSMFTCRAEI